MDGVTQLADGLGILQALHHACGGRNPGAPVEWTTLSPFFIDKGDLKVFPLARATEEGRDELSRVTAALQQAGIHFFGGDGIHAETALDADDGYGRRLAEAGFTPVGRVYAWRIGPYAAVPVHAIGTPAQVSTLSLHVFPAEWIWPRAGGSERKRDISRRRTMAKNRDAADASWTWPQV